MEVVRTHSSTFGVLWSPLDIMCQVKLLEMEMHQKNGDVEEILEPPCMKKNYILEPRKLEMRRAVFEY